MSRDTGRYEAYDEIRRLTPTQLHERVRENPAIKKHLRELQEKWSGFGGSGEVPTTDLALIQWRFTEFLFVIAVRHLTEEELRELIELCAIQIELFTPPYLRHPRSWGASEGSA